MQDKIDGIITHKIIRDTDFLAPVIFLVFYISPDNTWYMDRLGLAQWHGSRLFQGWVGGLMENANPLLYATRACRWYHRWRWRSCRFPSACYGHVFLIALLEDCGYMARATVVLDPIFKRVGLSGKIRYSDGHRYRMCDSGCYVLPYDS